MDAQITELVTLVEELAEELEAYGECHWAGWLRKDAAWIQVGDDAGVDHLLAAYGGMGSMSDLRLTPERGHRIAAHHVDAVNASLRRRGLRVYELARAVQSRSVAGAVA